LLERTNKRKSPIERREKAFLLILPKNGADISKFYETENLTKATVKQLIREGFFRTRKTTSDILMKFQELGLIYNSNDLSRDLANIVNQQILTAKKTSKVLKNGTLGKKMINEYWVENNFK
jgi:hypothetical protein